MSNHAYSNEIIIIINVTGVLIFGFSWIGLVDYKVKNIEKKKRK